MSVLAHEAKRLSDDGLSESEVISHLQGQGHRMEEILNAVRSSASSGFDRPWAVGDAGG